MAPDPVFVVGFLIGQEVARFPQTLRILREDEAHQRQAFAICLCAAGTARQPEPSSHIGLPRAASFRLGHPISIMPMEPSERVF